MTTTFTATRDQLVNAITDRAADGINAACVRAYNADLRRARGPQGRKPGAARPDGYR